MDLQSAQTKCVKKNAAKGTVVKVPKGIQNQEFQKIIEENKSVINPRIQKTFEFISKDSINIPKKKTRFINFLRNGPNFKLSEDEVEIAWNILEKYLKKIEAEKKTGQSKTTNVTIKNKINDNGGGKKKKSKKDTQNGENGTNEESEPKITANENTDNSGKKKRKLKNAEETTEESSGKSKKKKRKSETVEEIITETNTNGVSVEDTEKSFKKKKMVKTKQKKNLPQRK